MKQIQNGTIFLLCLMVVGFFANFAQNDYGLNLVVYCCLGISALLLSLIFYSFADYKYVKGLFLLACALLLLFINSDYMTMVDDGSGIFNDPEYIFLYFIALVLAMILLMVIIPILYLYRSNKKGLKVNLHNYFENLFASFFCLGIFMKNTERPAASIVLVLSGLIIVPYVYKFVSLGIKSIREKNLELTVNALSYTFVGLIIVAFIFKSQYWPLSGLILIVSFIDFGLLLILMLIMHFKITPFAKWWQQVNFTHALFISSFIITTTYTLLMWNNVIPQIYSNKYPRTYQNLKMSSNDFSEEGRLNQKKKEVYLKNYEEFLMNNWNNIKQ